MEHLREQWLIALSTPFYLAIIVLEVLLSHFRRTGSYTLRDTWQNLYLMLINSGIDLAFRVFYVGVLAAAWEGRLVEISNPFWYWCWLFIAEDFLYYWLHRVDHLSRFFWAVHVTHHSSEQFNLSVGFRSSVFQPLYRFLYFLPLAFLGFRALDIVFVFSATQIWGILVHTEHIGKLGWLEHILVTPSHHRVHHASNVRYLDRNLGMFLIIWDKLFGTFQAELPAEQYQPIRYGLTKRPERDDAATLIFYEWKTLFRDARKARRWREKLGYLFGPPGWSPDGSTLTARQMREQERMEKGN